MSIADSAVIGWSFLLPERWQGQEARGAAAIHGRSIGHDWTAEQPPPPVLSSGLARTSGRQQSGTAGHMANSPCRGRAGLGQSEARLEPPAHPGDVDWCSPRARPPAGHLSSEPRTACAGKGRKPRRRWHICGDTALRLGAREGVRTRMQVPDSGHGHGDRWWGQLWMPGELLGVPGYS